MSLLIEVIIFVEVIGLLTGIQYRQFIFLPIKTMYSSLGPFLCFTTNPFAQEFNFLANFITCLVSICNTVKS